MKTIRVILTKYSDPLSSLLYVLSGFGYTHASISLGETEEQMYSFNFKGFCVETLAKHRRRGVKKSMSIQLSVTDAAYRRMEGRIRHFERHREEYFYTKLGVLLSFLRIPFRREKHYFCSQFVAEMLSHSGAVQLEKHASLYLPNHFRRELAAASQLRGIQYNPV